MNFGNKRITNVLSNGGTRTIVVREEPKVGNLLEHAMRERDELEHAVRAAQVEREHAEERLQELSGRLINAHEEERSRIARELHDDLNQRLALLSIEIEQYGQRLPRSASEHRQRMHDIWERAYEISGYVHRMSHQLHPSKLDTLGLVAAVRSLCHSLAQRSALKPEFTHRQVPSEIPKDIALCLFRVVQEALSNAVKHSGAQYARVQLIGSAEEICLVVTDCGAGFNTGNVSESGLGLISMRERLRLVDGEFSIESAPGQGTRITARVPFALRPAEDTNTDCTRTPNLAINDN